MTIRRLPDGTTTEDAEEWGQAWIDFQQDFLDAVGGRAVGFTPGSSYLIDGKGIQTNYLEPRLNGISLPHWVLDRFNRWYAPRKKLEELMRELIDAWDDDEAGPDRFSSVIEILENIKKEMQK